MSASFYGWPTTRRYPRTLADAFADERACAIEHHRVPLGSRIAGVLLAVAIGVSMALLIVLHLSGEIA